MQALQGGKMKGRICYIVISVMLAVTIGFSFDISAYTPADSTGTAGSDKEETTVTQEKPVSNVPSLEKQDEVVKETAQAKGSSAERSVSAKTKAIASVRESSAAEESSQPVLESETDTADQTEEESTAEDSLQPIQISQDDRQILEKIVMAEAGCEDQHGQVMVADVILNRLKAGYGSTVADIVFSDGQFEPVSNGTYYDAVPSESVIEAVDTAISGVDYTDGSLYFVSCNADYSWFENNLTYTGGYGGHNFFK